MDKILNDLNPFFWMVAVMIAGITTIDLANIEVVSPHSDFVQAMTEPVEQSH
ncbi:MAG: hypothetical protein ACFB2W_24475 [Leptolyngbyaceae cyanobacterium]